MTARERRMVERLVTEAVGTGAPLPPVGRTDALTAYEAQLALAPLPLRTLLRVMVAATDAAPRRLASARIVLRRLAARSYYGDPAVMRQLGYDAEAVVARATAARIAEGRP